MLSLFRQKKTGSEFDHSLETVVCDINRKKKSSPCGPYFPGTSKRVCCAQTNAVPRGSKKAQTLSNKTFSTSLDTHSPRHFEALFSAIVGSLRVLFPQFQSRLISSQNVVFAFWTIKTISPVFGGLHFPESSRFLTFIWLPYSHFSVVLVQFLPFAAFSTFVDRLAQGMPVSVYQKRSPPVLRNVIDIDARFLGANFFCSERQFLGTFPDWHLGALLFELLAFVPRKALYLHSNGLRPRHSDYQL